MQILNPKGEEKNLTQYEEYTKQKQSDEIEMKNIVKKGKNKKKLLKKISGEENSLKKTTVEKANTAEKLQEDMDQKICSLCDRNRPVFVVDSDNMIKRMPERYLSPLLKSLKLDLKNNRMYLKYLRIKINFINPCQCTKKIVHSYCQTAKVVRQQKIYCEDCGAYYHLFVKGEKLCSSHLQTVFGRYICYFIMLIIFAQSTLLLDSLLKQNHR